MESASPLSREEINDLACLIICYFDLIWYFITMTQFDETIISPEIFE